MRYVAVLVLLFSGIAHSQEWEWARYAGSAGGDDYGMGVAVGRSNTIYAAGRYYDTIVLGNTKFAGSPAYGKCFLTSYDSTGNVQWAKNIVGSAKVNILSDNSGNCILLAEGSGSLTLDTAIHTDTNYAGIHLAKFNTGGAIQWMRSISSNYPSFHYSTFSIDSDESIYITGTFSSSIRLDDTTIYARGGVGTSETFLVKFDRNGVRQWFKNLFNWTEGVFVASSSDYLYLVGGLDKDATIDAVSLTSTTFFPTFILCLTKNGEAQWGKVIGGVNDIRSLICDKSGNVFLSASYSDSLNIGNQTYFADSKYSQPFLAKFDALGSVDWILPTHCDENATIGQVCVNDKGDCCFLLSFWGEILINDTLQLTAPPFFGSYIIQCDAAGQLLSYKQVTDSGGGRFAPYYVTYDSDTTLYIVGNAFGNFRLGSDSIAANQTDFLIGKLRTVNAHSRVYIQDRPETRNVYPNPARTRLHIKIPKGERVLSVSIISVDGKSHRMDFEMTDESIELSIGAFPPGLYTMYIRSENRLFSSSFVISQ